MWNRCIDLDLMNQLVIRIDAIHTCTVQIISVGSDVLTVHTNELELEWASIRQVSGQCAVWMCMVRSAAQ